MAFTTSQTVSVFGGSGNFSRASVPEEAELLLINWVVLLLTQFLITFFFLTLFIFERQRQSVSWGGVDRERGRHRI